MGHPAIPSQDPRPSQDPSATVQETFRFLPDAERWRRRWTAAAAAIGSNTPLDSVLRATAYPNFRLRLDAAWHDTEVDDDGRVRISAAGA